MVIAEEPKLNCLSELELKLLIGGGCSGSFLFTTGMKKFYRKKIMDAEAFNVCCCFCWSQFHFQIFMLWFFVRSAHGSASSINLTGEINDGLLIPPFYSDHVFSGIMRIRIQIPLLPIQVGQNDPGVGYDSDFHNLMGFASKKMPNNILKNVCLTSFSIG